MANHVSHNMSRGVTLYLIKHVALQSRTQSMPVHPAPNLRTGILWVRDWWHYIIVHPN